MNKEEAIKYLQQLYPNGGHCWLDEQRIEAIGIAVKALQEEPVKIKKGCKYRCLSDMVNRDTGNISFIGDKIYLAPKDDTLVSEENGWLCDTSEDASNFELVEEPQVKESAKVQHVNDMCKENGNSLTQEPVSEDLEEAAEHLSKIYAGEGSIDPKREGFAFYIGFKNGAKWQKENLWKPADGDDLPIIDREVIVLIKYNTQRNIHDKEYSTYKVGFGHRPNPDGWDGKNIDTNEVTHYTPKLYDKGGWNAPDIVYWLDIELPKEIEL